MSRNQRPRGSLRYQKPPLTLDELVGLLDGRGLHIPDPGRAGRYLRYIGYTGSRRTRSRSTVTA